MTIIIGLGNPGKKFENTRHNVGFMVINEFAKQNNFPEFKLLKKAEAEISEKDSIILVKPQTFMNNSGIAAQKILAQKNSENMIIIHDDVDLPIGKIKIVKDRGSAGHKGVESIIQHIGNKNLIRIRIGINNETDPRAMDIVLKKFLNQEKNEVENSIKKSAAAIEVILKDGIDKAMNEYN